VVVEKRTLSFDPVVWEYIDRKARAENTTPSAVVNETMRHRAVIERGLAAIVEWEHEHGTPTEDDLAVADRLLEQAIAEARAKDAADEAVS
jgi:hypothetical protein